MDDVKTVKDDNSDETENILVVNNIEVVYSHVILVLKGVSLNVKKGGITALLGGNGAGKSTTLKSISNLLSSERGEVTKGSVTFENEDIHDLDPSQLVKKGVIQVMEGRHCFEHLTVEENLLFPLKRNKSKSSIKYNIVKEDIIFSLELNNLLKRYPANLSGGEKLRVALARTILTKPDYLLLDEPLSDLDLSLIHI